MALASLVVGMLVGAVEIFLTGRIADGILLPNEKSSKTALWLIIKLALYAASVAAVLLFEKVSVLWAGVGYGVGMVAGCAVYLLYKKISAAPKDTPDGTERSDSNEND